MSVAGFATAGVSLFDISKDGTRIIVMEGSIVTTYSITSAFDLSAVVLLDTFDTNRTNVVSLSVDRFDEDRMSIIRSNVVQSYSLNGKYDISLLSNNMSVSNNIWSTSDIIGVSENIVGFDVRLGRSMGLLSNNKVLSYVNN